MFTFFKKEKTDYLFDKKSNKSNYLLTVKSDLNLGKENKRVAFEVNSKINIEQYYKDKHWNTVVNLLFICGQTFLPHMNEFLQEALALSNITSCLAFRRKNNGGIDKVINNDQIKRNWIDWKNEELSDFIPNLVKQQKFIQNYEKGLENINQIKNNFTYLLLMPPFYEIPHFPNGKWKIPKIANWNSRFITDLCVNYDYIVKQDNSDVVTNLIYQASNLSDINTRLSVRNFYQNFLPNHNYENYKVQILGTYQIEKDTGKIITGSLHHTESLNDNFVYNLSHKLKIIKPSS